MNNAQLDVLVSHWEGQQLMGLTPVPSSLRPQGLGLGGQSPSKSSTRTAGIAASTDKKRRSWDDNAPGPGTKDKNTNNEQIVSNEDEVEEWGSKQEMNFRKSLSSTLMDLSDREGLTDDELDNKVSCNILFPTINLFTNSFID